MSIITTILRAIGIRVVPPVYLDSPIDMSDIMLDSKINNEVILQSRITTDYDIGLKI